MTIKIEDNISDLVAISLVKEVIVYLVYQRKQEDSYGKRTIKCI